MSCSSVMPIPPWSWMACWVTRRPLCARWTLAAETARWRSIGVVLRDLDRGHDGHRAGQLGLDEHVDGAVLEGLEGANLDAELLARLEVIHGHREGRLHHPVPLGAGGRRADVERVGEGHVARALRAEEAVRRDGAIQLHVGGPAAIHRGERRADDARGVRVDHEEGHAHGLAPPCGRCERTR
jgi:hypothetical protein